MTSFATLRRLVPDPHPEERCDLCRTVLPPRHRHLLDVRSRLLVCACEPCSLLFPGRPGTKYRRVPLEIRRLQDFALTDGQWDSLMIPIGLAFFYRSSLENRVLAFYPSPAGPTESLLALDAWNEIAAGCPALAAMEPDVETLLVNRLDRPAEHYLAPIDKCYELAGLIRTKWRGLSGGPELWEKIRGFFLVMQEESARA